MSGLSGWNFDKQEIGDVFSPPNLIVVFANVLSFVLLETLFFWFVASNAIGAVVQDKATVVAYFAGQKRSTREALISELENEYNTQTIPSVAAKQLRQREEQNFHLVLTHIAPVAVTMVIMIIVLYMAMKWKGKPFTRIDTFLLGMVLFAFSTEIYFYITVTSQIVYVGDNELMAEVYKSLIEGLNGDPHNSSVIKKD